MTHLEDFERNVYSPVAELDRLVPKRTADEQAGAALDGVVLGGAVSAAYIGFNLTAFKLGVGRFLKRWRKEHTESAIAETAQEELQEIHAEGRAILAQESVLSMICPPLSGLANDAMEIAKVTTPVLVGERKTSQTPQGGHLSLPQVL